MNYIDRLEEVTKELASLHREMAQILMLERRAKIETWMASEEGTIKGRERISDFNSMEFTIDRMKLEGEIRAHTEEKDYLIEALRAGRD
jgi:hypothetical protein